MKKLILILLSALIFASIIKFIPFSIHQPASITVNGEASQELASQIAHFNVGVTVVNQDKQTALEAVNTAMAAVIQAVKDFGIDPKDIQTETASVYEIGDQLEILIYPPRPSAKTGWQATNSVSLVLRQTDRASALADLLSSFESTEVSGPSFSLDDTASVQAELLIKAVANAREKALGLAQASNRKLGKVITVSEGYLSDYEPYYSSAGMAKPADAPLEPGSATVTQTVTVTFELK